MDDVRCPYCGAGQEIGHDDGQGFEEDQRHEQSCACGKTFVYTTSIHYYYEVSKADCLNGAAHRYKMSMTHPRRYTEWRCQDCDDTKPLSSDEMAELLKRDQ